MKTIASDNGTLDEWVLLSRPADIRRGISVDFMRGSHVRENHKKISFPGLEDIVWERIKDADVEPKLGYHAHKTASGRVTVALRDDSDWPTFLATNLDDEVFLPQLLVIYNNLNGTSYSFREANRHEHFWKWASRYVDGTLAQAGALETPSGIAVARRSDDVAHYPGYWHTFGSFLPEEGEPLHRKGIYDRQGNPLTAQHTFMADEENLLLHSKVSLYHETGIRPEEASWTMAGFVYEFPHQTAEFVYHAKSSVDIRELDWQHRHSETRHLNGLNGIVDFLSSEREVVPAGQFSIVAAAVRKYRDGRKSLLEAGIIREVGISDNYLNTA